jgi:hypothetical protein
MKRHRNTLVPVLGTLLVLISAMSAYAQQPLDPAHARALAATHKAAPPVTQQAAPGAASLCFTCGGDWPVFSGWIPTPSAADERQGGCSGGFTTALNDHVPFLCSR